MPVLVDIEARHRQRAIKYRQATHPGQRFTDVARQGDDQRFYKQAGRNANRVEILAKVRAWTMAQASVAACCAALDAAGVPAAKVQAIDEVLADPQTLARGMLVEQMRPLPGRVLLPNLPFRFSGCDTSPSGPAPLLEQHNRQVAASLGYSAAQIDTLIGDGVLYDKASVDRLPRA